ncbi:spore germination protein [Clostridium sediminicola]|uniref:GerAB/ArcD/ProY family transporter n=1 Tax=Clostridium sediminicola TaxID=3114879 RepID=UPI0031F2218C
MNKEVISDKQGVSLVTLFIIGESSILVSGITAKKELWLAIIFAIFMVLPFIFLYSKLFNVSTDKNLFEIIEITFGKFIGKGIILIYTWYTFDLASLVLIDLGQFINIVNLDSTPIIVIIICIMILCAWIVKEGILVMGKFGELFLNVLVILSIFGILLLVPKMNINNLRPILYNGIKPVIKGAYEVFIYPFGETVVFTIAFSTLKSKKSIYKIYNQGLLVGGIFLLMTSLTIGLVIGIEHASILYYPAYEAIERIDVGNVLQRIEVISGVIFVVGCFIKISIYLLATCKGVAKIFECNNYRFIVMPISLLIVNLTYFEFDSIMSFNEWIFEVWIYYAFLFIVILPIIIWFACEIKKKQLSK